MTYIGRFAGASPANGGDMVTTTEIDKRAISIAEFCSRYGLGRTTAYEEIKAGRLEVVKAGKRTLVPVDAAESWLQNLPSARSTS